MPITFFKEALRNLKVCPVFWLFGKIVLLRNLNFSITEDISEKFTSATSIFCDKSKLFLDLFRVFIKE
jgi:hypothetical protein